uniref:PABC domain-containing protein n=2 Tax=Rodentolepis nana TaxID=102285 RepID=A0A0R3TCI4_RODNA
LIKSSSDSDKVVTSEQQQGVDYRQKFANIYSAPLTVCGRVPPNTSHLLYAANASMSPHLRLNQGIAGSHIQLGYPRIVAASPYLRGAMPVILGQSHRSTSFRPINHAFGGSVGAQQLMLNPLTTCMPGLSAGVVGGQQYWPQQTCMTYRTLGAGESVPHQTIDPTSADNMPNPHDQPNVQIQETPASTNPVPEEQTPEAEQHGAASSSSSDQHEASFSCDAGMRRESNELTSAERQVYGDIIFNKIAEGEPVLATKITGMILNMKPSFVLNVLLSDSDLKNAVTQCKVALAKKEPVIQKKN